MNNEKLLKIHTYYGLCRFAVKTNDLELLQWARQKGCLWDSGICSLAAEKGNLDILMWVRQNGCPWDSLTCSAAANHGHLNVLQWAIKNGCETSMWIVSLAAYANQLNVLQWALQQNLYLCVTIKDLLFHKPSFIPKYYQASKWLLNTYGFYCKTSLKEWLHVIHVALDMVIYVPDLVEVIKDHI